MATFTRTADGKVIFEKDSIKHVFDGGCNVLPHPREANIVLITTEATNQSTADGFAIDWNDVSTPSVTDRNDLLQKLADDFFFQHKH